MAVRILHSSQARRPRESAKVYFVKKFERKMFVTFVLPTLQQVTLALRIKYIIHEVREYF